MVGMVAPQTAEKEKIEKVDGKAGSRDARDGRDAKDTKESAEAAKKAAAQRTAALDSALGQIEKQYGKGTIMRLGVTGAAEISGISTSSPSLDLALGGRGIPRGRITEVYGPESSGKTTLCIHV